MIVSNTPALNNSLNVTGRRQKDNTI